MAVAEPPKSNPLNQGAKEINVRQPPTALGWDQTSRFVSKPAAAMTSFWDPPPPPRPDLKQVEKDYQQADDKVIDYRPQMGGLPIGIPFAETYRITETEGKLLDKLAFQRGLLGEKSFSDIKDKAFEVSSARYPDPGSVPSTVPEQNRRKWLQNDGHRDAFRHAYWNALMTKEFGAEWTKQYATAHEGLPGNPSNREAMDLYNNEVGRQIALSNPNATPEQLADLVEQAVKDGKLVVIPPSGSGLEWSDRVPLWGHGLTDHVVAGGGRPVPDGNASVNG
jgi:hypothetical protein